MTELPRNTILLGDATEQLRRIPPASVDCVVTSPPYYLLRDYGVDGQIGLEPSVEEWVASLRGVFAEVARVLKGSGSVWLNLADSYSRHRRYGAPPKSLLLGPERLLLALVADGWIVRNKVVWAKANPMPHSVGDRLSSTYDVVYFLVRSPRYYFDLDRIRAPHGMSRPDAPSYTRRPAWAGPFAGSQDGLRRERPDGVPGHWLGKNPGDVWRLNASNYREAHFATFPESLIERPILATCPEALCSACHRPWRRAVTVRRLGQLASSGPDRRIRQYPRTWRTLRQLGELAPACDCGAATVPGVVLDPFFGSGTVGVVAAKHGRDWIGIELNPGYVALAGKRLRASEAEEQKVGL